MMTGNVVAIMAGLIICAAVSFYSSPSDKDEREKAWDLTRDIDNPLTPWTQKYTEELDLRDTGCYHDRLAI